MCGFGADPSKGGTPQKTQTIGVHLIGSSSPLGRQIVGRFAPASAGVGALAGTVSEPISPDILSSQYRQTGDDQQPTWQEGQNESGDTDYHQSDAEDSDEEFPNRFDIRSYCSTQYETVRELFEFRRLDLGEQGSRLWKRRSGL